MTTTTFTSLVAFGDSLSDAGNLSIATTALGTTEPASPPYARESYTIDTTFGPVTTDANVFSNGPVWAQDLSIALGLGTLAPSNLGGNDYAFGGAVTGDSTEMSASPSLTLISLPAQLTDFENTNAGAAPGTLYTVSIGANDVLGILADTTLTMAQQDGLVAEAVSAELAFVGSLAADGARSFAILTVPDLGKTPEVMDGLANGSGTASAAFDATASTLSALYDSELASGIGSLEASAGITVSLVDLYGLIDNAIANPASYGLTDVTDPVWTGNFTDANSGTLASTVTSVQDQYLFFDHLHPTETGHTAIANAALDALTNPCFVEGTRIATERGDLPVERLVAGDRVRLTRGGTARITWIGHRRVDPERHPKPEVIEPVRVRAGAMAPGVPVRDLLLSPDHAVFQEGVLIPVRHLVNGVTIRRDGLRPVTYWHVELAAHDVLLAEGMACESYLDTGNRSSFANGGGAYALHPSFDRGVLEATIWRDRACAPLAVSGPAVEAARTRLLERAPELGARTSEDPAIRVLADGVAVPSQSGGQVWRVALPAGTRRVTIASRAWVPAWVKPAASDERQLGVAISALWLDGRAASLDSSALDAGWHAPEDGYRWTDGAGEIELDGRARMLSFALGMAGLYWMEQEAPARLRA